MNNTVSIIIPVYGVEQYLDRCLLSVVSQTYKDLEILVIDDGSKDRSGEICDEWAKKDKRIKVIHQENKGLASARNTGLRNMSGKYCIAIDSDDFIYTTAIEYLVRALEETSSDVAVYKFLFTFNQTMPDSLPTSIIPLSYYVKEGIDIHKEIFLSMNYQTFFWNKMYRSEAIKDIFLQDGLACYEDIESVPRFLHACKKAVFLNNNLIKYMIRKDSLSHDADKVNSRLDILLDLCTLNEKRYKEWFPELGKKYHFWWIMQYILFYNDIFTKIDMKEKKKIMFSPKYTRRFKYNSKGFLLSPYKPHYKILYLQVKIAYYRYKFHQKVSKKVAISQS